MSVYFVQAGDGGRIKVGYSPYPKQRIAYLGRFSGPDIKILAVIEGSRRLEHYIHVHLKGSHAHDEWFEPTPEVLEVARMAATLPQDHRGGLNEMSNWEYDPDGLAFLAQRDDVIGRAARAAQDFTSRYSFAVLESLMRLLGEVDAKGDQTSQRAP